MSREVRNSATGSSIQGGVIEGGGCDGAVGGGEAGIEANNKDCCARTSRFTSAGSVDTRVYSESMPPPALDLARRT